MQSPHWSLPFNIIYDATDYTISAILEQCRDKKPYVIYCANKTLNDTQMNYTIMEKEFFAIGFTLEKLLKEAIA